MERGFGNCASWSTVIPSCSGRNWTTFGLLLTFTFIFLLLFTFFFTFSCFYLVLFFFFIVSK